MNGVVKALEQRLKPHSWALFEPRWDNQSCQHLGKNGGELVQELCKYLDSGGDGDGSDGDGEAGELG